MGFRDLMSDDPAHALDVMNGDREAEFATRAFGHLAGRLATRGGLSCHDPFEESAGVEELEAVDGLVFGGRGIHVRRVVGMRLGGLAKMVSLRRG